MDKIHIDDFKKIATQKALLMDNSDIQYIINQYNVIVNKFCDDVLPHFSENKMIDKKQALDYLSVYANGLEVRKSYEHFKHIKFDEKEMKDIIEILKKPITELYMIGQISVQIMYLKFQAYVKKWWNEQRYKKIFKSDSPHKWMRKIKEYPDIDSGKAMWEYNDFAKIHKKVETILNIKMRL